MTINNVFSIKIIFGIFLFSILGVLSAQNGEPSASSVLAEIQKAMTGVKEIEANFSQEKKLSLFNRPIKLTGTLKIKFPHYFKWEVVSPLKTVIIADGNSVTTWDEETGETRTMSVEDNPVVKNIWVQIDSWFMGKYGELSKNYSINLKNAIPPILEFTPKSETLAAAVKRITVYFRKDKKYINKVLLEEKGGDSTVMEFSDIKIIDNSSKPEKGQ